MTGTEKRSQAETHERGVPIAWFLPLVLAGLVLAAVLPVVVIGYFGARDNTGRLLRDKGELVLDIVVERVTGHLDPVRAQLGSIADAVRRGALKVEDDAAMAALAGGPLATMPQVAGISLLRPNLPVRRYSRSDFRGSDTNDRSLPAIVQTGRQGSDGGRADSGMRWAGPVWSPPVNQPVLVMRTPLTAPDDEGSDLYRGEIIAEVSIAALSRFMAEIGADIGQTPFILLGRDRVLAHPALASDKKIARLGPGEPLARLEGFFDPVLAGIWREPRSFSNMPPFRQSQGHWSWLDADSFDANGYIYRALSDYGDASWIIGVHFPSTETRRERWVVIGIGVGGLLLLACALAAAAFVGRRLGRPMLGLAHAAARIEALDFGGARSLARGPVREINQAAGAFERMAAGLGWFETYLPKTLVRRLMAAGAGAGTSETREVTVMFTDLQRYTDFSSQRPAADVVSYLNDLLARIGPVIEASGGTIDKFIGDGVMAFWGAPEEQPGHAAAACHAACTIASEVEAFNTERRARGGHACRMRIGLHTGSVAVGNIGFSGRVDYTIIGRTVNIAQRVEQLGRGMAEAHEVVILVSEETRRRAGPDLVFEPCRIVQVDGGLEVFRLVCVAAHEAADR